MTHPRTLALSGALYLLLAVSLHSSPSAALSDSVCVNTAASWATSSSHLEGEFPYYSMLFFCESQLNLESLHVDACINYGSNCGQAAADEFCQYIGFEGAAPTLFTTTVADAPARSMTGEWCVEAGNYQDLGYLNRTELEAVNSTISGTRCERLDSVVCFNSRDRLASNNNDLHATAANPPETSASSSSETPDVSSTSQENSSVLAVAGPTPSVQQSAVGGRRHLLR